MIKSRYYKIANKRNLKKWQISKSKTLQVKEMANYRVKGIATQLKEMAKPQV